jgi:hypothetical protein
MLVVIGSAPDREHWLADCSASIKREHIAVVNTGYELGKISWVINNTNADRFLFLQDSWIVKDEGFWDLLDEHQGSVAINSDPYYFGCYTGVYERWVIEEIGLPTTDNKDDAIRNEVDWHKAYVKVAGEPVVLFPDLTDKQASRTVERHGRVNLVLENNYIAKYKGTWF